VKDMQLGQITLRVFYDDECTAFVSIPLGVLRKGYRTLSLFAEREDNNYVPQKLDSASLFVRVKIDSVDQYNDIYGSVPQNKTPFSGTDAAAAAESDKKRSRAQSEKIASRAASSRGMSSFDSAPVISPNNIRGGQIKRRGSSNGGNNNESAAEKDYRRYRSRGEVEGQPPPRDKKVVRRGSRAGGSQIQNNSSSYRIDLTEDVDAEAADIDPHDSEKGRRGQVRGQDDRASESKTGKSTHPRDIARKPVDFKLTHRSSIGRRPSTQSQINDFGIDGAIEVEEGEEEQSVELAPPVAARRPEKQKSFRDRAPPRLVLPDPDNVSRSSDSRLPSYDSAVNMIQLRENAVAAREVQVIDYQSDGEEEEGEEPWAPPV
jgi:hypothetical protein